MSKIGKYRMIPAGTKVWSIALQEHVIFDKDIPVKITHTVYHNKDYVYGKLQLLLFEHMIPGVMDRANGDIGFLLKDTVKWEVPKPKFLDFNYE
jgi:hypothetical protein